MLEAMVHTCESRSQKTNLGYIVRYNHLKGGSGEYHQVNWQSGHGHLFWALLKLWEDKPKLVPTHGHGDSTPKTLIQSRDQRVGYWEVPSRLAAEIGLTL